MKRIQPKTCGINDVSTWKFTILIWTICCMFCFYASSAVENWLNFRFDPEFAYLKTRIWIYIYISNDCTLHIIAVIKVEIYSFIADTWLGFLAEMTSWMNVNGALVHRQRTMSPKWMHKKCKWLKIEICNFEIK